MKWYSRKNDALKVGMLHIAKDENNTGIKKYAHVSTYDDICKVINQYKCVYEILTNKWTEFYDFDGNGIDINQKDIIIHNFTTCYISFIGNKCKILVKECIDGRKISLHFIIPNSIMDNYNSMKKRFNQFIDSSSLLYKECYDGSIYTKDRLIRTNESDKCFTGRVFRSDTPTKDLLISHPYTEITISHDKCVNEFLKTYKLSSSFRIDSKINDTIYRIKRTTSSLCMICNRIHDSENAFINIADNSYGCFRDLTRKIYLDSDIVRISRSKLHKNLDIFIDKNIIDHAISRSQLQ